ncbi:hypothetical protein LCGC14_3162150, partial [marine sediment metagenome]
WGLIAQIRIGGLNTKIARLDGALVDATKERDDYRDGLHDLKSELQKSGLSAARDIRVLKDRVDQCREDINALPDSQLTRDFINGRLDRLLQGETPAPRDPSSR